MGGGGGGGGGGGDNDKDNITGNIDGLIVGCVHSTSAQMLHARCIPHTL